MPQIIPIPALHDNYIWLIMHPKNQTAYAVDPGDAAPVKKALRSHHLTLKGILITHHHWDHTNGITDLIKEFGSMPIYGSFQSQIPEISIRLQQDDQIHLDAIAADFSILEIPGHTLDHIAFVGLNSVFCGDTLFAGGCGRLFEGSADQMLASLQRITALSKNTNIYCAHEYTLKNLQFASLVEPDNLDLQQRLQQTQQTLSAGKPTIPSTVDLELKTNPFLRCHLEQVQQSIEKHCGRKLNNAVEVFSELRKWKDQF